MWSEWASNSSEWAEGERFPGSSCFNIRLLTSFTSYNLPYLDNLLCCVIMGLLREGEGFAVIHSGKLHNTKLKWQQEVSNELWDQRSTGVQQTKNATLLCCSKATATWYRISCILRKRGWDAKVLLSAQLSATFPFLLQVPMLPFPTALEWISHGFGVSLSFSIFGGGGVGESFAFALAL